MTTTQTTTDQLTASTAQLADDLQRLIDATSTAIGTDEWLTLGAAPVREAVIIAYNDATHYITAAQQAAQCADAVHAARTNAITAYQDAHEILRLDVIDIVGRWTTYMRSARISPTIDITDAQHDALHTARQLMRQVTQAEQEMAA
jgi:hypothetical protein